MLAGLMGGIVLSEENYRQFLRGKFSATPKGRLVERRFVIERRGPDCFLYLADVATNRNGFVTALSWERVSVAKGAEYTVRLAKKGWRAVFPLAELQEAMRKLVALIDTERSGLGGLREELDARYEAELKQTQHALRTGHTALGERVAWAQLDELDDLKPKPFSSARTKEIIKGFKAGARLPPIVIGWDAERHERYIIDGNHRLAAARKLKMDEVLVAFAPGAES